MSLAPRRALNPWPVLVVGIAALVILPVALMASEALTPDVDLWRRLWDNNLRDMLSSTVALCVLVSLGTMCTCQWNGPSWWCGAVWNTAL